MLLRFGVRNHLSLRDEEALTFTQSALVDTEVGLISTPAYKGSCILPAAVIYGPNAAGKSNILSAVEMMHRHVVSSHTQGKPAGGVSRSPFALNKSALTQTSKFELDFIQSDIRYNYGYETDGEVYTSEWLHSFTASRAQRLFLRTGQSFRFGRAFRGQNRVIEGLTRPNSLYVSAAAQNGHEEALKIFNYVQDIKFGNHISIGGEIASVMLSMQNIDSRIINFLGRIGTGVVGYIQNRLDFTPQQKALQSGMVDLLKNVFKQDFDDSIFMQDRFAIKLEHKGEEGQTELFDLDRESAGTRRLLVVLGAVFQALDSGSPIVVDELDASLHTQAVESLLALFSNRETNPHGAQLIATVHDTNLLRSQYLRRDQIWFAEKDKTGATILFPMSDIQTRRNDNLEKGYLQGRFGAIPFTSPVFDVISDL